jgi:hypothetical protein
MSDIVIAMYVIKGDPKRICKKSQIFRGKIPAGKDQLNSFETLRFKVIVKERFHII